MSLLLIGSAFPGILRPLRSNDSGLMSARYERKKERKRIVVRKKQSFRARRKKMVLTRVNRFSYLATRVPENFSIVSIAEEEALETVR